MMARITSDCGVMGCPPTYRPSPAVPRPSSSVLMAGPLIGLKAVLPKGAAPPHSHAVDGAGQVLTGALKHLLLRDMSPDEIDSLEALVKRPTIPYECRSFAPLSRLLRGLIGNRGSFSRATTKPSRTTWWRRCCVR